MVENILPYFRHPSFRPYQEETIRQLIEGYDAGYKFQFMEAPTGAGKSDNYMAFYNWANVTHQASQLVTTPLKVLQKQLERDFPNVPSIMGKDNYECEKFPGHTCADELCRIQEDILRRKEFEVRREMLLGNPLKINRLEKPKKAKLIECCACYGEKYLEAIASPIMFINFAMLMSIQSIKPRDVVVIDEAQAMDSFLMNHFSVTFDWRKNGWTLIDGLEAKPYLDQLGSTLKTVTAEADALEEALKKGKGLEEVELLKKTRRFSQKLKAVYENVSARDDWLAVVSGNKIEFTPTCPQPYYRSMFSKGKHVIISSATPPTPDILGIPDEDVNYIPVPSSIPIENRPVFQTMTAPMRFDKRGGSIPKIAKMIPMLVDGKTIVHCHSYEIMFDISNKLADAGVGHVRQDKRNTFVSDWQDSEFNIGLSVNFTEGIDLIGEMARTNIIVVLPWPNIMDPVVKKRIDIEGKGFMHKIVADKIVQAYGRTTRAPDDFSTTYILPTEWQYFYKTHPNLFPQWFKDAIV